MRRLANSPLALKLIVITILVLILSITSVGFIFYNEYRHMRNIVEVETIYNNIFINDISVGGLTKEEAYIKLEENITKNAENTKMTLIHNEEYFEYYFLDFAPEANIEQAVQMAYLQAREGTVRERYEKITYLNENPYEIEMEISFDINKIYEVITPLEENVYITPVNATMTRNNNTFTVIEGSYGAKMDVAYTAQQVYDLLYLHEDGKVDIVTNKVDPQFNGDDFRQSQSLLGSFTTTFTPGNNGRNANIRNASNKINGYILYPGEVFSTNDAFGEMSYANGYRYATIILNGQFVDGIGGGVCQVSTNLYMAALYAELEIVQRQNHSRRVGYVPPGFDATLASDIIDLRFRNNTDKPIFIESITTSNSVTVNIYGHETRPAGRSVTFENAFVENIPPSEEIVREDPSLPAGTRVVETAAQPGVRYNLYKVISQDGVVVGRERVNTSTYRPVTGVVRVGTGAAAPTTPTPAAPTPAAPTPPEPPANQPLETGYETINQVDTQPEAWCSTAEALLND